MARHRKIDLRMHGDEKYRRLTPCPPCGQALWWHLLAGRQTGIIPGVCVIGESAFAEQLGWPLKGFREAFREVFREGMARADWTAHLVWVPNAVKYNEPANPNVVKSWASAWDEVPECELKVEIYEHLKAFLKGFGKGFQEAFDKACRKPSGNPLPNQEQEQEQEQDQEQEKKRRRAAFVPPTEADVRAYGVRAGKPIDAAAFVAYYASKGWLVGKAKMVDWQRAVDGWHSRDQKSGTNGSTNATNHRRTGTASFDPARHPLTPIADSGDGPGHPGG